MSGTPTLVLIHPWITDFAAYDLWSSPLGLLELAGALRGRGYEVRLIDCLDVHHPGMTKRGGAVPPVRRRWGTGKFWRTEVEPPVPLASVGRPYHRYGISPELFLEALEAIPAPSAVLVTSLMTYWYPGVQEAVSLVRRVHPGVPVLLGGIYASLCREHALRHSGADRVATPAEGADPEAVCRILDAFGVPRPHEGCDRPPAHPAFDLVRKPDAVCVATSSGCPYRCGYCASPFLRPSFHQRPPGQVVEEILHWRHTLGVRDVAFYDDALLVHASAHIRPVLEGLAIRAPDLRFHVPNALHVREITERVARLLRKAGVQTIRLGLETADFEYRKRLDRKVARGEFEQAVRRLRDAGYARREVGVYVMMGLPGQSAGSVKQTLEVVDQAGAVPYLAEYSPIPHTALWPQALAASEWDLSEPLFQNNTLVPCWDETRRTCAAELRARVRDLRRPRLRRSEPD